MWLACLYGYADELLGQSMEWAHGEGRGAEPRILAPARRLKT